MVRFFAFWISLTFWFLPGASAGTCWHKVHPPQPGSHLAGHAPFRLKFSPRYHFATPAQRALMRLQSYLNRMDRNAEVLKKLQRQPEISSEGEIASAIPQITIGISTNPNANSNPNSDPNSNANSNANPNTNPNPNTYFNPSTDSDLNPNTNPNANPNPNTYFNPSTNANPNPSSPPNTNPLTQIVLDALAAEYEQLIHDVERLEFLRVFAAFYWNDYFFNCDNRKMQSPNASIGDRFFRFYTQHQDWDLLIQSMQNWAIAKLVELNSAQSWAVVSLGLVGPENSFWVKKVKALFEPEIPHSKTKMGGLLGGIKQVEVFLDYKKSTLQDIDSASAGQPQPPTELELSLVRMRSFSPLNAWIRSNTSP